MGHNIHYFHLFAENAEDACNIVENEILEWGNENNWRTVLGAIDRNGVKFENEKDTSSWEIPNSFAEIEKEILEERDVSDYEIQEFKKLIDKYLTSGKLSESEWSMLGYYAKLFEDEASLDKFSLDDWDTFRAYEYDSPGLTNIEYGPDHDGLQDYIIYIDMHS